MKLIIPSHKKDLLNREPFAISLTNIVKRVDDCFVISLDAPWGEGKTFFVKMWQDILSKENIKNIYFDAFANDYIDDPFIAIAGELATIFEEHHETDKLTEYKKAASKAGAQLLSWGAKVGIKIFQIPLKRIL